MLKIAIGYDVNNIVPGWVLADSILAHSSNPVEFTFLRKSTLAGWNRERSATESTDFSITRFLVPHLHNYTGWTLYLDNDIVCISDISKLFEYADSRYAVMVVKHNYEPKSNTKFLNNMQTAYSKKNWSSVMLFNNSLCRNLTMEYVSSAPGLDLHQFKWCGDGMVGELPGEWNHLVGYSSGGIPKLIHYTDGGPYFKETVDCGYASEWWNAYHRMVDIRVDPKNKS